MIRLLVKGIIKHTTVTKPNAISMALLYPILVMYEVTKKETMAMLRSLKGSSTATCDFVTSKLFCTSKITVPTLLSNIAKTK
jgi:hypothetical protein